MSEEDQIIKVILIGNSGVGKTSIINRFYLNKFEEKQNITFTANFIVKNINIDGKTVILNVWDTAGQEKFKSVNKIFIKNSNIIIFVYDITNHKSFEELDFWYKLIIDESEEDAIFGLAGNKADIVEEESVSIEEGQKRAEEWGATFALLSAKEDKAGISSFFTELVKNYLGNPLEKDLGRKTIKIDQNDIKKKKSSKGECCEKKNKK